MNFLKKIRKKFYRLIFRPSKPCFWLGYRYLKNKISLSKEDIAIISIHNAGETYLLCAMARHFKKLHKIKGKIILLGTKSYHRQIYKMFAHDVGGYYQLDPYIAECLKPLRTIKSGEIFYCADHDLWTSSFLKPPLTHFSLLKMCNFIEGDIVLSKPEIALEVVLSAKEKFKNLGLLENKTIFISPESTSLKALNKEFWEDLCGKFIKLGYEVFYNVVDQKNIPANAKSKFLNFSEALVFANLCGNIVSSRSGLCEVISSSSANLHILYPTKQSIAVYSMKEISTAKQSLFEYACDENSSEALMQNILRNYTSY